MRSPVGDLSTWVPRAMRLLIWTTFPVSAIGMPLNPTARDHSE